MTAQSNPGFSYGFVPTPAQWNSYFSEKQDALGFTPLNVAGGTLTGALVTTASIVTLAGLNVPPGTAPAQPNAGDVWTTSAGIFAYINGQIVSLAGGGGSGGPVSYIHATAGFAAQVGQIIDGDTSAGPFAIALPTNPSPYATITFVDLAGTWATNPLDINPGTNAIGGQGGVLVCNVAQASIELVFVGGSVGWAINPTAPISAGISSGQLMTLPNLLAIVATLPTTLPAGSGQLWNNTGTLSIS